MTKPSPDDVVFVCTTEECTEGPWESRNDAMKHSFDTGHAYTGASREEIEAEALSPVIEEGSGRPNWLDDE